MNKNDINIKGEYRVQYQGDKGRAVVTGPAVKNKYANVYSFPVEFPDSIRDGKPETANIESRAFMREWTEEDDERFQRRMEESDKVDTIEEQLKNAGFAPDLVRMVHGEIWLSFRGDASQRVVQKLTT